MVRKIEEIKRHVRALKVLLSVPCNCHKVGPTHSAECVMGGYIMAVAIDMLEWALGSEKRQDFVDKMNAAADEFTRTG
jgi:hypothetical protein